MRLLCLLSALTISGCGAAVAVVDTCPERAEPPSERAEQPAPPPGD